MRKLVILFVLLFVTANAEIFEEGFACVKYERKDGSLSKPYYVSYFIVDGKTMARSVYFRKYPSYDNYVVTLWPNGGYSAFAVSSNQSLDTRYRFVSNQNNQTYKIKKTKKPYCVP